ncbi:hypothetical protein MKZ38_002113 [Zalerion maritima]|uniref:Uncharacterized protein n=1 Tax=Zalerion maritima TaxID=339359 RepID=A0AAD5RPG8_9PEZI|nr:hypothetical protein MKZ38_002113 [Zalerion maritima]
MDSTQTSQSSASQQPSSSSMPQASYVPPAPKGGQTGSSTDPFLRDFTLVAEAAKRAQMACMIRDLGDIGLS